MAKKKLTFTISLDEDVAVAVIAEAMKQAGGALPTSDTPAAPVNTEEPLLPVSAPSAPAKAKEPEQPKEAPAPAEEPDDPQSTLIAMLGGEETPGPEAPAEPTYTHDALKLAAREWVLAGADLDEQKARTNKISGAIMKAGAKAVSEIVPEKLGEFAETLKGLGVQL